MPAQSGLFAGIVARMKVDDQILVSDFLKVLDLVGTFAFALSGAVSGVKHRIDLSECSYCPSPRRPRVA